MGSINILFGIVWLVGGLMWLRRAMADEARPSAPRSLFTQSEMQTGKDRRLGIWLFVFYVMLGVLYLLKGIYSHQP